MEWEKEEEEEEENEQFVCTCFEALLVLATLESQLFSKFSYNKGFDERDLENPSQLFLGQV
jgi:hypothetical protein